MCQGDATHTHTHTHTHTYVDKYIHTFIYIYIYIGDLRTSTSASDTVYAPVLRPHTLAY